MTSASSSGDLSQPNLLGLQVTTVRSSQKLQSAIKIEFFAEIHNQRMLADASCRPVYRHEADFPAEKTFVFQGNPDEFWAEQGGAVNIINFRKIDMYGFEKNGYF
jgi:hypothetical protein